MAEKQIRQEYLARRRYVICYEIAQSHCSIPQYPNFPMNGSNIKMSNSSIQIWGLPQIYRPRMRQTNISSLKKILCFILQIQRTEKIFFSCLNSRLYSSYGTLATVIFCPFTIFKGWWGKKQILTLKPHNSCCPPNWCVNTRLK